MDDVGTNAGFSLGKQTAAAGSPVNVLIPPRTGKRTKVTTLRMVAGDGADTVAGLDVLGTTTANGAAAAGQITVTITADPGNYTGKRTADNLIAAGDYLSAQLSDYTWWFDEVAAVSGLDIGMTSNLPTLGIADNAIIYFHGAAGDTNPRTAQVQPSLNLLAASSPDAIEAGSGSIFETTLVGNPLLLGADNSANITDSTVLSYVAGVYGP